MKEVETNRNQSRIFFAVTVNHLWSEKWLIPKCISRKMEFGNYWRAQKNSRVI